MTSPSCPVASHEGHLTNSPNLADFIKHLVNSQLDHQMNQLNFDLKFCLAAFVFDLFTTDHHLSDYPVGSNSTAKHHNNRSFTLPQLITLYLFL